MKTTPIIISFVALLFSLFPAGFSEESKATGEISVLLFVITDCPIANRYAPEINRIYDSYSNQNVSFTLVYTNQSLSDEDIERHRKEYRLKPSGILDKGYKLTARAGATITPEAVVYTPAGDIAYRGRIDDWFTDYGDQRREPTERNLRLALDAVLAGEEVKIKRTEAIGCLIER